VTEGIREAIKFAGKAHKGQKRRFSQNQYITHPIGTYVILKGYEDITEDQLIASILHDVVEDTDVKISEIDEDFGEDVAEMVFNLTNILPNGQSKKVYMRVKLENLVGNDAFVIKLADRIHNLHEMDFSIVPVKFIYKYVEETKYVFNDLFAILESKGMYTQTGRDLLSILKTQVDFLDSKLCIGSSIQETLEEIDDIV